MYLGKNSLSWVLMNICQLHQMTQGHGHYEEFILYCRMSSYSILIILKKLLNLKVLVLKVPYSLTLSHFAPFNNNNVTVRPTTYPSSSVSCGKIGSIFPVSERWKHVFCPAEPLGLIFSLLVLIHVYSYM